MPEAPPERWHLQPPQPSNQPAGRHGPRPAIMTVSSRQDRREDQAGVHFLAARFFRASMRGSWVPGYLAGRGFGAGVQERWRAGYAPA